MVAIDTYLGVGLYTVAEAAMYAKVTPGVMSRWVFGGTRGEPALQRQMGSDSDEKIVTFWDMVQAMAVRAIRRPSDSSDRVPLQSIREAVDLATARGVTYPFARMHTIYRYGQRIVLRVGEQIIDASGKVRGHPNLRPVVETFMKDIGYGVDGLANSFTAFEQEGVKIVMRPDFQFGEPMVGNSGTSAWTLWEACDREGGIEAAAQTYRVEPREVLVASRYIDFIRPATAA